VSGAKEQEDLLTEVWEELAKQGPGHRLALATRAITVALAATPLFVLDQKFDLLRYKGIKGNALRWAKVLTVSEPLARGEGHGVRLIGHRRGHAADPARGTPSTWPWKQPSGRWWRLGWAGARRSGKTRRPTPCGIW
jgi:hypothetical protein